jgi:hypothetical protein
VYDGKTIRVRFVWRRVNDGAAEWSQALSTDGEAQWETNWTMSFARA